MNGTFHSPSPSARMHFSECRMADNDSMYKLTNKDVRIWAYFYIDGARRSIFLN
jgi:hypothetical protein